ncbi:hypothetical protein [Fortiea contorta]|uniref:hypothetical protein n=1 Tax=Fortiea contorta TaxID=1892405 RepID=UPI0003467EA5|nr:hypothetical protein [Fortiea contorta]
MKNPFKGGSANEFGAVLPDGEAQLHQESERIEAHNQKQADKKCEEIAEAYGGTNPDAKAVGKSEFDCRFKIWR